jgi:HEAT repeat protein
VSRALPPWSHEVVLKRAIRSRRLHRKITDWRAVVIFLMAGSCASAAISGEEAANTELLKMVTDLVSDSDRDMRALGFQQIREESPGEASTLLFAALLPKLQPDAKAGLIEALADRGDRAARPAVLTMMTSDSTAVRAAAIRALGALGIAADVPTLAEKTSSNAKEECEAAKASLIRLRGSDMNPAILAALSQAAPKTRAALLSVLAARNAKDAVPVVLQQARDADLSVRLAALDALRQLSDAAHTEGIARLVTDADSPELRWKAELALRAVCSRNRAECVAPILGVLQNAGPDAQVALLRALARAGGEKSFEAIAAKLNSDQTTVRMEAVRLICEWPDRKALPQLVTLAEGGKDLRTRVLAIRGIVRLASEQADRPADVTQLAKAMTLSSRAAERKLTLGALGSVASVEAIGAAAPWIQDGDVGAEAAMAVVLIAEKLPKKVDPTVKAALEKATQIKNGGIGDRAKKLLDLK